MGDNETEYQTISRGAVESYFNLQLVVAFRDNNDERVHELFVQQRLWNDKNQLDRHLAAAIIAWYEEVRNLDAFLEGPQESRWEELRREVAEHFHRATQTSSLGSEAFALCVMSLVMGLMGVLWMVRGVSEASVFTLIAAMWLISGGRTALAWKRSA